jgi:hypothetical protein
LITKYNVVINRRVLHACSLNHDLSATCHRYFTEASRRDRLLRIGYPTQCRLYSRRSSYFNIRLNHNHTICLLCEKNHCCSKDCAFHSFSRERKPWPLLFLEVWWVKGLFPIIQNCKSHFALINMCY